MRGEVRVRVRRGEAVFDDLDEVLAVLVVRVLVVHQVPLLPLQPLLLGALPLLLHHARHLPLALAQGQPAHVGQRDDADRRKVTVHHEDPPLLLLRHELDGRT